MLSPGWLAACCDDRYGDPAFTSEATALPQLSVLGEDDVAALAAFTFTYTAGSPLMPAGDHQPAGRSRLDALGAVWRAVAGSAFPDRELPRFSSRSRCGLLLCLMSEDAEHPHISS